MAIEWEEKDVEGAIARVGFEGVGASGEVYAVWYGLAFVNPDTSSMKWIALGWPEPDSDNLPLFDSCEEAMALCEAWDIVKVHAAQLARALFRGVRAGEG